MNEFFAAIGLGNFVIVLGVLIFVHEMGHYLVARWCNVRVEVFSIGFGREIFGWTDKKGTRWKLSILPLGGYVKMFGEGNAVVEEEQRDNPALSAEERSVSFAHKNVWQRSAVVAAGPFANFLFAIAVFSIAAFTIGVQQTRNIAVEGIGSVQADSPAQKAGMRSGDRIIAIDGNPVEGFEDLVTAVRDSEGRPLSFTLVREGQEMTVSAAPALLNRENPVNGKIEALYTLGVSQPVKLVETGLGGALSYGFGHTWDLSIMILKSVGRMISGRGSMEEVGGPIKIAQMSSDVGKAGWLPLIGFMAMLSINLGLLNLFPVPMLDGGHLVFYFFELLLGKPVDARIQEFSLRIGVSLLLGLMIFFTINDILNID